MLWLAVKAIVSALIIVAVAEIAKRSPGVGALVASLPVVSVLGIIWLWSDTHDVERLAQHSVATFWFVLPSLPMFLFIPLLLRSGLSFWLALLTGCVLTMLLYLAMVTIAPKFGLHL